MPLLRPIQAASEKEWKAHRRFWEMIFAGLASVVVIVLAIFRLAFFSANPPHPAKDPSIWDYLFGDRLVLGAVRLMVFSLALFITASFAGLLVAGRWASALGKEGVKADPAASDANEAIDRLNRVIASQTAIIGHMARQRDVAFRGAELAGEGQKADNGSGDVTKP